MAYYWCSLTFDEVGTLLERNSIVYGETEQEFIRNMSHYLRWHFGTYCTAKEHDMRLKRMEAEQNMSGTDLGLYSPAYPNSDNDDAVYFIKDKQLCSFEGENLRVLDLRNYHEAILAHAVCFAEERLRYCRKKKQGKRHKKGWNHHWHKGIRNCIKVSILDVREKKLGYDRSKTVKVFRSDTPEVVLCYITAETAVCDVPKKQANSTGKGLQITGITVSKSNMPLLNLLSEVGLDKAVIFDWVKRTRLTELRKCIDIAMNVLVDADDDSISESCRVAAEFSEKVQSRTNTYVQEIRKIQ